MQTALLGAKVIFKIYKLVHIISKNELNLFQNISICIFFFNSYKTGSAKSLHKNIFFVVHENQFQGIFLHYQGQKVAHHGL